MSAKVVVLETRRTVNRPAAMLKPSPFITLTATENVEVEPGEFAEIPTGVGLRVPVEHIAKLFVTRPIAARGLQLINCVDLITPNDEAEIVMPVKNIGKEKVTVDEGEPVAIVTVEHIGLINVQRISRPGG